MNSIERTDIKRLIEALRSNAGSGRKKGLSKRLLKLIDVPTRRRVSVNLYKLDKLTKEGDSVIVPGKVLSEGRIGHRLNIAAIEYSRGAIDALNRAGAKMEGIESLMGSKNVKIIV